EFAKSTFLPAMSGVHSLNLALLQVLGRRTEGHHCQNENCWRCCGIARRFSLPTYNTMCFARMTEANWQVRFQV
ncbi:MAG: hypothetical protein LK562_14565, partial [Candidatus Accumulibacter phosphatis]|nr:hypothetical protein [Candidatus Accumulibacter phosphatis]